LKTAFNFKGGLAWNLETIAFIATNFKVDSASVQMVRQNLNKCQGYKLMGCWTKWLTYSGGWNVIMDNGQLRQAIKGQDY